LSLNKTQGNTVQQEVKKEQEKLDKLCLWVYHW